MKRPNRVQSSVHIVDSGGWSARSRGREAGREGREGGRERNNFTPLMWGRGEKKRRGGVGGKGVFMSAVGRLER